MIITDDGVDEYNGVQYLKISDVGNYVETAERRDEMIEWIQANCQSYVSCGQVCRIANFVFLYCFTFGFTDHNEAMLFRLTF